MNKLTLLIITTISLFSCSKSDNASSSNNSTNSSGRLTKVTMTQGSVVSVDSLAYDNNGRFSAFYRKENGVSAATTSIIRNTNGVITNISNVNNILGMNLTASSDALGRYQRSVLTGPGYNDTIYYTYTGNKITQVISNRHENGTYQIDKTIITYDGNDNMIKDEHFYINTTTGVSTPSKTYESTFDNKQSPYYSIFNLNDYFIMIGSASPGQATDISIGQNNVLTNRETLNNSSFSSILNIQYNYNSNNKPYVANETYTYGTVVYTTNITFTY